MPAFQPYWGKPAVRNDRGERGDVGIIRSPVRASFLPDCGGYRVTGIPTATATRVVSFQEEFRKLLDAHGIAYDERYVWD